MYDFFLKAYAEQLGLAKKLLYKKFLKLAVYPSDQYTQTLTALYSEVA